MPPRELPRASKRAWLPFLKRGLPAPGTVLSAALIVVAFPPLHLYPVIWFALVPVLAVLRRTENWRAAAREGLWLSILMSLGGFYWVSFVLQEFAGLPWAAALGGLFLFSLIGQPQFTIFFPFWRKLRARSPFGPAGALALALGYAGLDWFLPKLFVDTLGHSQYLATNLRQAADLGGATLLTFSIFLANQALEETYSAWRAHAEPSLRPLVRQTAPSLLAALAVAGALWGYGAWRASEVAAWQARPLRRVQMAVIQANIGDFDKIAAEKGLADAAKKVVQTYTDLSEQALALEPRPQVIIWPETSYPSTFRTPQTADELARDQDVERLVKKTRVPVLFGGYDHQDGKDYNSFFFLSPEADRGVEPPRDLRTYHKNVLLLFGEYIPGADWFPFIKKLFPQVGNFGRGVGPEVIPVVPASAGKAAALRTGPIICYEALFPNFVIAAARQGAELILNITNDSWFGPYGEPILHLSLTTFRGIETRLPQLRATNTGISTLILPDGEITQPTTIGAKEILNVSVPTYPPLPTLMKAWGDWFGWFALGAGTLLSALLLKARRPV